jgi:polysaccharide deacetylase family protein (PEP-CTERM system associated)
VKDGPRVALSFDVEEWFQTSAMRRAFPEARWDSLPRASLEQVGILVELLRKHECSATFFVLGWILDREPEMVHRLLEEGHEFASHGYWHRELTAMTPSEFSRDLDDFAAACERNSLPVPQGYRAPSFTMVTETVPWAVDELVRHGYAWDSSVFPISRHRHGMPEAPQDPFSLRGASLEIGELPLASLSIGALKLPAAGGAWMRLYPSLFHRAILSRICARGRIPVLYSHPWEYGRAVPLRGGVSRFQLFRQSFNAGATMLARMDALLERFRTVRLGDLWAQQQGIGTSARSQRPGS